jgi:hypothetical protein
MENSFIQSLLLHSNTNIQQQHQQPQQQQQSKVQPAEDNFFEDIETQSYEIEQSTERPKATIINYVFLKLTSNNSNINRLSSRTSSNSSQKKECSSSQPASFITELQRI